MILLIFQSLYNTYMYIYIYTSSFFFYYYIFLTYRRDEGGGEGIVRESEEYAGLADAGVAYEQKLEQQIVRLLRHFAALELLLVEEKHHHHHRHRLRGRGGGSKQRSEESAGRRRLVALTMYSDRHYRQSAAMILRDSLPDAPNVERSTLRRHRL